MNLFTQKNLTEAIEKAERRIKREKKEKEKAKQSTKINNCLLYTSPSPRDGLLSRMPSSA